MELCILAHSLKERANLWEKVGSRFALDTRHTPTRRHILRGELRTGFATGLVGHVCHQTRGSSTLFEVLILTLKTANFYLSLAILQDKYSIP